MTIEINICNPIWIKLFDENVRGLMYIFEKYNIKVNFFDYKTIVDIYKGLDDSLYDKLIIPNKEQLKIKNKERIMNKYKHLQNNLTILFLTNLNKFDSIDNKYKELESNYINNNINYVFNNFFNKKGFILIQPEHLNQGFNDIPLYMDFIQKALHVIDFNSNNFDIIQKYNNNYSKFNFTLNTTYFNQFNFLNKTKDILFIGVITPRRKIMLDIYKKLGVNIDIVSNVFNINEKIDLLNQYKIIINIKHLYNNFLETHRINFALMCNCLVVSESNPNDSNEIDYKDIIYFFHGIDGVEIIKDLLLNYNQYHNKIINNYNIIKNKLENEEVELINLLKKNMT